MQIGASVRGARAATGVLAGLMLSASLHAAVIGGAEAGPLGPGADTSDADGDGVPDASTPASPSTPLMPHSGLAANPSSAGGLGASNTIAPRVDRDIGSMIKDTTRPVYEDIIHSDILDALRGLDTGSDKAKSAGLDEVSRDENGEPSTRKRNWEALGGGPAGEERPRNEAERKSDQIRASILLVELINEIKPWAFGAIGLYILGYLAKAVLTYRRKTNRRRVERRRHRSRSGRRH